MTSRRNQLLKKLIGTAIGEDEKKLYQLTIERVCADMCEYYYKFYHNEGPGAMVYVPEHEDCLLYTSPSPRDRTRSRMPSSA